MFPANPLIELILRCCLAKAQRLHKVETSHLVVEPTHIHFIARVSNPDDIKGFMERFKTESSHAINRLLGRRKRTIWCAGYDSPVLLTPEDVVNKIVYCYLNPSRDGLADSIDTYLGFSSWKAFLSGQTSFTAKDIARSDIEPLGAMNLQAYLAAAEALAKDKPQILFTISPNAWMQCFNITTPEEIKYWNQKIIEAVRSAEKEYREQRAAQGRAVIAKEAQLNQRIGAPYTPERTGKRMYCISSDVPLRKQFIQMVKELVAQAADVLKEWRKGNFVPYPPGLYPPSFPKLANILYC